jgi:hypothetical protein
MIWKHIRKKEWITFSMRKSMFRLITQDVPYAEAGMCHSCGYFYAEDVLLCKTCRENVRTTIICPTCEGKEVFTGTKADSVRCVFCQSVLPNINKIEKEDRERMKFHISENWGIEKND